MALPVPIGQAERRLPQAGRIRIGIKDETKRGKDKRRAIDTFRFTSGDADLYDAMRVMSKAIVRDIWRESRRAITNATPGERSPAGSHSRQAMPVTTPDSATPDGRPSPRSPSDAQGIGGGRAA